MRQAPRRAARRDIAEAPIVKALRDAGYLVTEAGWLADLLVYDPAKDRLTLLEVKAPKGKLTPTQESAIAQGWPVAIVRSVEDAFNALDRAGG